jgi:hypothetical protein
MDVAWDDDQGGIFHRTLEDDSVKLLVLADARDFADAAAKARERFRLLQKSLEGMSPAKQCRFFAVLTDRRNLAVIEVTEFSEKECIITWSLARIQFREGAIQVEPYQQLPTGSDLASDPFGQRSTAQIEDNPRAAAADALSEANAVRLRMAEADFARASKLYESKLISESEYNKARRAVELRRAELGNDPAEVGRLKLQQAEEDLERTTRLHAQKLVGEQALDDARNAVELLQAELKGDVVELSRARLRHAEGEWQRLSELRKLNLCSEAELDQARLTVDVARADLESASVGRNRSAEDPNGGQASKSAATRSFVRLVVDESQLTFEGKETRWEQLPELLEKVPNRASTVLELAIDSDRLTIAQLNDAQARAGILSRRAGFEYLSYVGVQPLGSKGSPSSPRQTGNLATLLRDLSSAKVDAKRSPEMLAQQLVQGATNENEALQHLLLQSVSKPQKALIDTGPREAVQRWLELVKAGKSAESWQWIVPKSKSVLGPEEILRLNNRAQIEPRRSLGSDEAAMVVTSRFKDNSDRERVAYF